MQVREWGSRGWVTRDTLSAGEAREILSKAKHDGLDGKAKLNRALTRQQAWDIFIAGIAKITDDHAIDSLTAKNIMREFGKR